MTATAVSGSGVDTATAGSWRCRAVLLLLCALLFPGRLAAQQFPADSDLGIMLRYLVEDRETTGIVLALREAGGTTRVLHHGSAGPDARPLGPQSIFDIGSITKTFTAAVLADMVLRGEVALDDPVGAYLPEQVSVPAREGREITLLDLATHTSGLPALPDNLRATSRSDPYAGYTVEMLFAFLAGHELRRAPGTTHEYSNLGYGLLGHALARAAGMSYRDLLRERVLDPLGMDRTGFALDGPIGKWMAQGHRFGVAVPHWSVTEAMEGAGGLRSDAGDMLKYLDALTGPPETNVQHALQKALAVRLPLDGGVGQALAWRVRSFTDGTTVAEHGGSTGGFQARLAFVAERGIGTIVLANENSFRDALALDLLLQDPPPAGWERVRVRHDVLAGYAGDYHEVSGYGTFRVRLEDGGYLSLQQGGQVRARLYPTSDTTFHLLRHPWSVTFRPEPGRMAAVILEVDERRAAEQGRVRSARRIGDATRRRTRRSLVRGRGIARGSISRLSRR
jgi:serine-type D-Ala-D-Ala carboxypeptidase/endopeptidase